MNATLRLGLESDMPGEARARGFPALGLFVVRFAGRLHAWRDACPHEGGTPLAWRRDAYLDAGGTRIVCSAHGAQFETDTGRCTLGPCLGQALTRVPLRIAADGTVVIEDDRSHQETTT